MPIDGKENSSKSESHLELLRKLKKNIAREWLTYNQKIDLQRQIFFYILIYLWLQFETEFYGQYRIEYKNFY